MLRVGPARRGTSEPDPPPPHGPATRGGLRRTRPDIVHLLSHWFLGEVRSSGFPNPKGRVCAERAAMGVLLGAFPSLDIDHW